MHQNNLVEGGGSKMCVNRILIFSFFLLLLSGCDLNTGSRNEQIEKYKIYNKGSATFLLNTETGQTWALYNEKGHIKSWDSVYFEKNMNVTLPAESIKLQKMAEDIIKKEFGDSPKKTKPNTK